MALESINKITDKTHLQELIDNFDKYTVLIPFKKISDYGFEILFQKHEIVILYKGERFNEKHKESIIDSILKTSQSDPNIYTKTFFNCIQLIIEKDKGLLHHVVDMPYHYKTLFLKHATNTNYHDMIMQVKNKKNNKKDFIASKEEIIDDSVHIAELMALPEILNSNHELEILFNILEESNQLMMQDKTDKYVITNVTYFINNISRLERKITKLFVTYKLYSFLKQQIEFVNNNNKFKITILNKMMEFKEELNNNNHNLSFIPLYKILMDEMEVLLSK